MELERHERQIAKARLNKASCMSNTKWRKLFNIIRENLECDPPARVKLLAGEETFPFCVKSDIHQSGIKDNATQAPINFKEIEWIHIFATKEIERYNREERLKPKFMAYDIENIKELIENAGKYEYDFDEDGIRIYGYK
jgi:hypothetical protein